MRRLMFFHWPFFRWPFLRSTGLSTRRFPALPWTDRAAQTWLCVRVLPLSDLVAHAFGTAVTIVAWPHFGIPFLSELHRWLWPV